MFLTKGQRETLDVALGGYLRLYEAAYLASGADYPLMPAGRLVRHRYDGQPTAEVSAESAIPVNARTLREWFDAAEEKAGVPPVKGRGWYGMRRRAVDEFKRLGGSKDALKEHGGWTDTTIPDMVYADQEAEAPRVEARDIRAQIRGELPTPNTTQQ
jgi:hypothetical protein